MNLKSFFLYLVIGILGCNSSKSQVISDARNLGMAGIGLQQPNNFSTFYNPANFSDTSKFSGLGLSINLPFSVNNLSSGLIRFNRVDKSSSISVGFGGFYHHNYSSLSFFDIAYGLKVFKRVSLGIQIGYERLEVLRYSVLGNIRPKLGFKANLSDKVNIQTTYNNTYYVNASEVDRNNADNEINVGLEFKSRDHLCFYTQSNFSTINRNSLQIGAKYIGNPHFDFYAGYQTFPQSIGIGFAYRKNKIVYVLGLNYQSVLGTTPASNFEYYWQK